MLVKKKNSQWYPSEQKDLKVGETVDITDPKTLILNGDVVAVDETTGAELSAFDLYGVIVHDERKEFEEYLKAKREKAQAEALKTESENLKKELKETSTQPEATSVQPETTSDVETSEYDKLSWFELRAAFQKQFPGEFKPGLDRTAILQRLKNK